MKIACLSGKGGAGKTLVAVNLIAAAGAGTYIDCDVEEPNGRLFLKPENLQTETVSTLLPDFDVCKIIFSNLQGNKGKNHQSKKDPCHNYR